MFIHGKIFVILIIAINNNISSIKIIHSLSNPPWRSDDSLGCTVAAHSFIQFIHSFFIRFCFLFFAFLGIHYYRFTNWPNRMFKASLLIIRFFCVMFKARCVPMIVILWVFFGDVNLLGIFSLYANVFFCKSWQVMKWMKGKWKSD